jgi:hypothetical protein
MHYDNSFFLLNIGQRAALLRYRIAVLPQCAPRANKTMQATARMAYVVSLNTFWLMK